MPVDRIWCHIILAQSIGIERENFLATSPRYEVCPIEVNLFQFDTNVLIPMQKLLLAVTLGESKIFFPILPNLPKIHMITLSPSAVQVTNTAQHLEGTAHWL